jgi:hypothetical protein
MPIYRTEKLQKVVKALGLSQTAFEQKLLAVGLEPGTAKLIASTENREFEATDDAAVGVTNALEMTEEDLEAAGAIKADGTAIIHPFMVIVVALVGALCASIYWGVQRAEPDVSRLSTTDAAIVARCDSTSNLPAYLQCRAEVIDSVRSDWAAEWLLTAAQDQALWTFVGVLITGIALPVTAAGVWYVAHTLAATRRAARAADRAAHAALQANNGFQRSSEQQLRAYLSTVEATVTVPMGAQPSVSITLKNAGQTPAHDVQVRAAIGYRLPGRADDWTVPDEIPNSSKRDVGPGVEAYNSSTISGEPTIEPVLLNALKDPRSGYVIRAFGIATYKDAFGHARTTAWRFRSRWDGNGFVLDGEAEGNYST